jgi:hypothetical protein
VKEIVAKVEEKKPEIIAPKVEPVKEIVANVEETKAEKRAKKKLEAEKKAKPVIEPVKEVVAKVEEKKPEIVAQKPVEKPQITSPLVEPVKEEVVIKEDKKSEMPAEKMADEKPIYASGSGPLVATVSTPVVEPVKGVAAEKVIKKEDISTTTMVVVDPNVTNIIEMTPSVVTTISDANFVEPTSASNRPDAVNINIVDKPESANVNVAPSVKKENLGSVRCKYLVVVGTYAAEKNAIIQQKIVKNKGYADVEVIRYQDNNLYGVCVKQSNDEKEAYSVAKTVAKGGIDAFVKVLK